MAYQTPRPLGFAPVVTALALGLSSAALLGYYQHRALRGKAGRLLADASAVIFDIDGTLIDSVEEAAASAWHPD